MVSVSDRTAANVLTLIGLLDDILSARLTGDKQERARIGEHEWFNTPLKELMEARKMLVEEYESLAASTEYWDNFNDGVTSTGSDNTVSIGDTET